MTPPYLPLYITFISAFSCKLTSNAKVLGSSDWTLVDADHLGHDLVATSTSLTWPADVKY